MCISVCERAVSCTLLCCDAAESDIVVLSGGDEAHGCPDRKKLLSAQSPSSVALTRLCTGTKTGNKTDPSCGVMHTGRSPALLQSAMDQGASQIRSGSGNWLQSAAAHQAVLWMLRLTRDRSMHLSRVRDLWLVHQDAWCSQGRGLPPLRRPGVESRLLATWSSCQSRNPRVDLEFL